MNEMISKCGSGFRSLAGITFILFLLDLILFVPNTIDQHKNYTLFVLTFFLFQISNCPRFVEVIRIHSIVNCGITVFTISGKYMAAYFLDHINLWKKKINYFLIKRGFQLEGNISYYNHELSNSNIDNCLIKTSVNRFRMEQDLFNMMAKGLKNMEILGFIIKLFLDLSTNVQLKLSFSIKLKMTKRDSNPVLSKLETILSLVAAKSMYFNYKLLAKIVTLLPINVFGKTIDHCRNKI
ncbi:hypothetical protein KUTeg_003662 [Tegillarca granosa]|uniref:Uncharacterized protein n=1 Tax=Tegillarca granosa TaxID=220873 RepID=A0ABQ9FPD9_TEGGR|nr:hypothetical protein KUTeg_003662 [Tegillarca granosa]